MAVAKMSDYMDEQTKKALNPDPAPEATEADKKRNYERVEPVHMRKLLEHMTGAELARRLKCSAPVINTANKQGTVYASYEELCRYIWEAEFAPKPAPDLLVIVRTPPSAFVNLAAAIKDLGLNADVISQEA